MNRAIQESKHVFAGASVLFGSYLEVLHTFTVLCPVIEIWRADISMYDACQTCETLLPSSPHWEYRWKGMAPDAAGERRQGTGRTSMTNLPTDGDGEVNDEERHRLPSTLAAEATPCACVLIRDVDLNLQNGSRGLCRVISDTSEPSWLMTINLFFS